MIRILVAEDAPDQAALTQSILEEEEYQVDTVGTGTEAVSALEKTPYHLVITDLNMPEMDGLALVKHVAANYSHIPVILMTAFGSEEIAAEALRCGAASYVPKETLLEDLVELVDSLAEVIEARRDRQRAARHLHRAEFDFEIGNDTGLIAPLIAFLDEEMSAFLPKGEDDVHIQQIGTAVSEALLNGVHHGNLEVDSKLRDVDPSLYLDAARTRQTEQPYRDRTVRLHATLTSEWMEFVVEDDGPGFDTTQKKGASAPANVLQTHGRGLYLIRTFMDEVVHNDKGNRITMRKRLSEASSAATG